MTDETGRGDGEPAGRRVLVIDDDRDFADSLADLLTLADYVVTVAYDAAQAEAAAERFGPDLALVDYALGRTSGLELVKSLRQRRPGLVCAMMSAHADPDIAELALPQGLLSYLVKPLEMDDLLATIERAAGSRRPVAPDPSW